MTIVDRYDPNDEALEQENEDFFSPSFKATNGNTETSPIRKSKKSISFD